jgi:hypothetical protein
MEPAVVSAALGQSATRGNAVSPRYRLLTGLVTAVCFLVLATPAFAASLSAGGHQVEGVPPALVVPAALLATWATLLFRSRGPYD